MAWEALKAQIALVIKTNGNQGISGILLQQELFRIIDEALSAGVVSTDDLNETIRKTLNPYSYTSYLPSTTPFTTALIAANTPTKVKVPTTIKSVNGFAIVDRGGGNMSVQYQGAKAITLRIFLNTGVTASTNNTVFGLSIYKNNALEEGLTNTTKLQAGADVATIALSGELVVSPNDFLEIWLSTNVQSTYTFSRTSILMFEKN